MPRVLLVEDVADSAELLASVLRRAGFDVVTVDNGVSAMAWFWATLADDEIFREAGKPFDIYFLDCAMQRLDGLHVGENIRRAQQTLKRPPALRLYGYTAHAEVMLDAELMRRVGFDGFFEKPRDMQALFEFIEKGCPEQGTMR